jgi:hypothetical protein
LDEVELCSPFRFAFLRARRQRVASREGLYAVLFDAFLEARESDNDELPLPDNRKAFHLEANTDPGREVRPTVATAFA